MSTFRYHKPGIGNASSYVVSGIPWHTSSVAPALSTTSTVVNLPRVTNYVTIKNTSTTEDVLRFTFNSDNIVDNTNYITLESGESFSAQLRVTDIHLISDTETPVPFSVIAGLTNIDRVEMSKTTPTAPNLLKWVQKQKLINDSESQLIAFGDNVVFSQTDNTIFIRAVDPEDNYTGKVFVFENSTSGYQLVQQLTPSFDTQGLPEEEIAFGNVFGGSMFTNLTGEILAISAPQDDENGGVYAGAVYIFQSGSQGYQQVQKLTASFDTDGQPEANPDYDRFGYDISMNSTGDILAIGAYINEENGIDAGSVYIFQSSSIGYQQVQKLTASGDADTTSDWFGSSVSMNATGDIIAIGSYNDRENGGIGNYDGAGSVYIFQSSSIGYQQVQKLTASGDLNPANDRFGNAVSINSSGDILAIGAYGDEENGDEDYAGSVYIFQSGSLGYQQVQKLTASGDLNPANDIFGISVSLNSSGDILAIGAADDEENGGDGTSFNGAGSVYVFQSGSQGYQQVQKLTASGDANYAGDRFGIRVSLNPLGGTLLVGAHYDSDILTYGGSAYIFKYTRDY